VVVADARPEAFALPGRTHRVVVSDGMLRALTATQQQALLAHERAHLDGRHDRLRALADLAAAVNPFLFPGRRAMAYLCERAADERAGIRLGDRGLVAEAVAVAALAGRGSTGELALDRLGVVDRVHALASPAPRRVRPLWVAAAMGVAATIVVSDFHATTDFILFLRGLMV
jgi:hypothetical protein